MSILTSFLCREMLTFGSLGVLLLLASLSDLESRIIPNRCILAAIILRLITWIEWDSGRLSESLPWQFLAALLTALAILLVNFSYQKMKRKRSLGAGDIKLLFVGGLFLLPERIIYMVFISLLLGLLIGIFGRKRFGNEFPLAPAISLAILISIC